MIALLEARKAGLFAPGHFLPNVIAGLIVGVVALPLAMAFAIASGAAPENGIYTAIVAGIVVSLFGGSRVQIAGPTGAFIVILAGITAQHGFIGLQIATLMGGCLLLLMGLLRLGSVIRFIPSPVIVGFTAGIGVIIFVSQWKDFFGLPAVKGGHFHEKLLHLVEALPRLHTETTLLAVFSLLLVVVTPYFVKRVPGPLVAMIAATLAQSYFQFDGVATIGSTFGGIPHKLPALSLPAGIMPEKIWALAGPACAIAFLGAIESLLSATVADGMAGTRHNPNQELIGQGLANILCPLLGGFAATGAIARTATNIRNGGTSPLAGIVHSITLLLIILCLAPLAEHIPLCALSAILFVVAYNMSEPHHVIRILATAPRNDVIVLALTFLLTVFTDLVIAVNVGVVLSAVMFMQRMSVSVRLERCHADDISREHSNPQKIPHDVMIYYIDGPFFFGVAETMQQALISIHDDLRVLILRLKDVPFIDITGIRALEDVIRQMKKRGVEVRLCEANARVSAKLRRAGLLTLLGEEKYFPTLSAALK